MAEGGLSAGEVGKEIAEHHEHAHHGDEATGRDRVITIVEALLLAVVAVLAAWSGFASSKWSTESSLTLARASAARSQANRADLEASDLRNFDAATFNTWFTAYIGGNQAAEQVAVRRFRPEFKVAFDAWMATDPLTNPKSPPGPTYMAEYKQPELDQANALDAEATRALRRGSQGRLHRRRLRAHHRLPGHGAVPGRHLRALPGAGRPLRAGGDGGGHPGGGGGHPHRRPQTALRRG